MKKYVPLILTALLLLTLAACTENAPSPAVQAEPAPPVETPTPVLVVTPPEETPSPTPEPEVSISLSDLVGFWILSHATNEAGEDVDVVYSDWLTYAIEIREDYTFTWHAYGALFGDLDYEGDGRFSAFNLIATSEGDVWHPKGDEVTISYDSQSGLLRYTRVFNDPQSPTADTQHQYFTRAETSPFPEPPVESIFGRWVYAFSFLDSGGSWQSDNYFEFWEPWLEVHEDYTITISFWPGNRIEARLIPAIDTDFETDFTITDMLQYKHDQPDYFGFSDALLHYAPAGAIRISGFHVARTEGPIAPHPDESEGIHHIFERE